MSQIKYFNILVFNTGDILHDWFFIYGIKENSNHFSTNITIILNN